MRRSSVRVALLLLLVFLAGGAGGVALERSGVLPGGGHDHGEKKDRDDDRAVIERFSEEIGLSDDQEARIDTILEHYRSRMHEMWRDVRPRYRNLVDSARTRIEEVLTEAQTERYRELLERRRERRRDGKKKDEDRSGVEKWRGAPEGAGDTTDPGR